ncbi:MAG: diguanylate cyclase [Bacilli bacterium]|nr:diguanylate cyclase [Bacilli bacterium]
MEIFRYLANNIPLFSICAVMIYIAFRNLRLRRRESLYFLAFSTILVILSVVVEMEKYSQRMGYVVVGTIFTSLGYILRPSLLFIFILLANMEYKRTRAFYLLTIIPLGINLIIYLIPLFMGVPAFRELVFYYEAVGDGTATFNRGTFLNFTSHAISLFYLGILVYVSTMRFQGKHRRDGIVLIICVAIIFVTVLTEVLAKRSDLLNVVCGICMMINYIFILSVNSSRDPLTNLYDRRTYYEDVARFKSQIKGVIQIDVNGLKNLNDNYGHDAGDKALLTVGRILENSIQNAEMCVYHLSGDEFLILMFQGKNEALEATVNAIRLAVEETEYSIAIGYYFVNRNENIPYEVALKKAEQLMYSDKEHYYQQSGNDRRRR